VGPLCPKKEKKKRSLGSKGGGETFSPHNKGGFVGGEKKGEVQTTDSAVTVKENRAGTVGRRGKKKDVKYGSEGSGKGGSDGIRSRKKDLQKTERAGATFQRGDKKIAPPKKGLP